MVPTSGAWSRVFTADSGQIRSGWRLALFCAGLAISIFLMREVRRVLTGTARPDFDSPASASEPYFLLYRATGILAIAMATTASLFIVDRKRWSDLGCLVSKTALLELGKGSLLGVLIMLVPFLALLLSGHAMVNGLHLGRESASALLLQFVPLTLLVAFYEELLFRGYPFQVLCEGVGPAAATVGVGLLFGLAHYQNPNMTFVSAVTLTIWGVLLSLLLIRTRSLWPCVGLHFAGNLTEGFFLGSPVSGLRFSHTLLTSEYSGAAWLTGGGSGVEASLPALFACAGALFWTARGRWWRPAPESRLLFHPRQSVTTRI